MTTLKFNFLKTISLTLIVTGALFLASCQDRANQDDNKANTSEDSVHSGLEGTRDQAAQVGGADVKIHTGTGKTGGTGGLPGGSDSVSASSDAAKTAFLAGEVEGNYAEIRLSDLALQNANSADIKAVAQLLKKDHTAALSQLKSLASNKKVNVPGQESVEYKSKIDDLAAKKGSGFDKAWCEMLMDKHQKTVAKYEEAAKNMNDAEIKSWVTSVLPKLRLHHDKLMASHSKIK